jgi:hypothetical protein
LFGVIRSGKSIRSALGDPMQRLSHSDRRTGAAFFYNRFKRFVKARKVKDCSSVNGFGADVSRQTP